MKKTLTVLRHELATTLGRRSFLFMAFGIPLVAILIFAAITIIKREPTGSSGATSSQQMPELAVEGYVDQSGLIDVIPESIPPGHLLAYDDEEQAQQAMAAGEIAAYYVIPEDYVARGELFYVYPDSTPLISDGQEWLILRALLSNLLDGNDELAEWVWNPMDLESINLTPESQLGSASESSQLGPYLPAAMVLLLFMSLMINANLLSESVSSEKENRTIEILMLSITPQQMLAGKIIGLGIAGLLQTIAWIGTVFLLVNTGGQTLNLPPGFTIPTSILAWALLFFLLGFAMYASLLAGVGALASKLKEASQASFLVLAPLLAGYVIGLLAPLTEASRGALPVALSLFPLTAPVVMIMRLTDGSVPSWQLLLSAGLMGVTTYLIVRAVAAMFRAQHLLSGQPFSVRRYFGALLGRE